MRRERSVRKSACAYKLDPGTSPGMSAKPRVPPSFPSPTSTIPFYPFCSLPSTSPDNNHPVHLQMDQNGLSHQRYPSTCIPSLMPPGVDPSSVDFRTFFPYIPNEVKHRKRTSRHQLKVLEDIFRKDTKPNAVLRKKLATELDMSPRAVQVCPPPPPPPPPLLPLRRACSHSRRALLRFGSRIGTSLLPILAVALTPPSQARQGKSPSKTRFRSRRAGQGQPTPTSPNEKVSPFSRPFPKRLLQLVYSHREARLSHRG